MTSRETGGGNHEENPADRRARLCRKYYRPDGHGRRVLCGPRRHDKEVHGGGNEADDHDYHRRRQRHLQDQDGSRNRHEDHEGLHGTLIYQR